VTIIHGIGIFNQMLGIESNLHFPFPVRDGGYRTIADERQ
jgi:hypothetical protein